MEIEELDKKEQKELANAKSGLLHDVSFIAYPRSGRESESPAGI